MIKHLGGENQTGENQPTLLRAEFSVIKKKAG